MPSSNSSDLPKGRGRSSRRSGGDGSSDARRSSYKKSSGNKSDKGGSFPKRNDSKGDSRKFGGDSNSSKRGGWKKPFTENSGSPKSEFGDRKNRRDETPGEKRYPSRGGRYTKSDNDSRGKRDESSGAEKRYSSKGGRYSKPDSDSRGKRDEASGAGKSYSSRGGRYSKPDNDSRSKRDESSGAEKRYFAKGRTDARSGKDFRGKRDESSGSEKKYSSKGGRVSKSHTDFRGKRDESSSGPARRYSSKGENYPKFDKTNFRKKTGGSFSEKGSASEEPAASGKVRLNRYIANSGVCSRREADELIKMGLISVNGVTITELGYKVNPGDEVRHEGKLLRREKPVYILMNKPKGFLTTTSDPEERNTVMHLISNFVKERVYPVGRLDRNTTGLLLLTNDGDLAEKLMHPSYNVKKIYKVDLDRPLTKGDAQKIIDGVRLEEGVAMVDDLAIVSDDRKTVGIEIHIGWNRVIRRIFEALEYEVLKLDRSVYAGLTKKELGRGEWRFLKNEELVVLKHLQ
jgi:23S rRNA pseudouridine2605 synthase